MSSAAPGMTSGRRTPGLTPSTDNLVTLRGEAPAVARDFLVLRAWDDDSGGFEETWRLEVDGREVAPTDFAVIVSTDDG